MDTVIRKQASSCRMELHIDGIKSKVEMVICIALSFCCISRPNLIDLIKCTLTGHYENYGSPKRHTLPSHLPVPRVSLVLIHLHFLILPPSNSKSARTRASYISTTPTIPTPLSLNLHNDIHSIAPKKLPRPLPHVIHIRPATGLNMHHS